MLATFVAALTAHLGGRAPVPTLAAVEIRARARRQERNGAADDRGAWWAGSRGLPLGAGGPPVYIVTATTAGARTTPPRAYHGPNASPGAP